MSSRDPFELLRAINPVPGLSERVPSDDAMFEAILAAPAIRRRRRPPLWVTGGAVVAIGVGLAAFVFLRKESPSNPLQLLCYPAAEQPPAALYETPMSDDPVASCGELWTNGDIARNDEPPTLTACVLDTGVIAVIPGTQDVCGDLGFANWVGELSEGERNLLGFQQALIDRFLEPCVTEKTIEAEVRSVMAEYGVADWELVQRGGYNSERQCSAVGVVAEEQLVVIASRPGKP